MRADDAGAPRANISARRRARPSSTDGQGTGGLHDRRCTDTRDMTAADRIHLSVDGLPDMSGTQSGFHPARFTHTVPHSAASSPVLQHPDVLTWTKAGMRIIRAVRGRWRQRGRRDVESRSSSCGCRRGSAERRTGSSAEPREPRDHREPVKPRNRLRVVALGAPGVGKTNILRRFLGDDFQEGYEPTTEDFHRKLFHVGGEAYQVDLLDAAGERDFPAKRRLSILTGDIFLLVFSLDDRRSLGEASQLLAEIRAAKAKLRPSGRPPAVPLVVCGNKADLDGQRVVSRSEATELLGEDVPLFETSAKTGTGLEGAFGTLASLGGLPDETGPSRHQLVPLTACRALCAARRGWRRGRGPPAAPCAAVDALARRPSFTSDLRLVLGSSTSRKHEKCQIQ